MPPRPVAEALWSIHRTVYRLSGGRLGARLGPYQTVLLTTRGRRSGEEKATPLLFIEDGETLVVVASNLGADQAPAWLLNLRDEPRARARIGRRDWAVRGREAGEAERERLWPRLLEHYEGYEDYRQEADRHIPIVLLEPDGDREPSG